MLHDSPGILVLWRKWSLRNSDGSSPMGEPNAGGLSKNCIFNRSPAQTPYRRKFVSIHRGDQCPQRCDGRGIYDVINNTGGNRSWWITSYGPVDINKVGCTEVCWWHAWHCVQVVRQLSLLQWCVLWDYAGGRGIKHGRCWKCSSDWNSNCLCYSYNNRPTLQLTQSVPRVSRQ